MERDGVFGRYPDDGSGNIGGRGAGSTVEANYYDGEAMPVGNERRTAGTAYLFENLQGSVDTITDQEKDKCPENARPVPLLLLRILAEQSADKALVEYIVYWVKITRQISISRRNTWHNLGFVYQGRK